VIGDPCPFGDPYCPCVDGDACHYVDLPGSPAMARVSVNGIPVIGSIHTLPVDWEDRGTLLGVPEGEQGVRLPPQDE
jgi:hypothetical protein